MKKLLCIALVTALCLGCASLAAAESSLGTVGVSGIFELRGNLPEGYEVVMSNNTDDYMSAVIANSGDAAAPMMILTVAFDELYSDVQRLNDLDAAALAEIEETFAEEDEVEITYTQTSHGTKLMMVRETTDEIDYVAFFTIYLGYAVEFDLMTQGSGLTEEQIAAAVRFLSDLEFVPVN